jgi:hypothetical protein
MPSVADVRMQSVPVRVSVRDHHTVEHAIDRLAEAVRSVVADHIEVARLDAKVVGGRMLRGVALLVVGALMLGGSWAALTLAVYVRLAPELSPEQRLALIALAHGLFGMALLLSGARVVKAHDGD